MNAKSRVRPLSIAPVVVVAVALVLVGCSSAGSGSTPGGEEARGPGVASAQRVVDQYSKNPAGITQTVALPAAPPKGKSIVFLSDGLPGTVQTGKAVAAACKAIGWTTSTVTYDAANPSTFQAALTTALQHKPAAVAEEGTPTTQITASVLDDYRAAAVPIIAASVDPLKVTDTVLGPANTVAFTREQGKVLANWFVADSGGRGHALVESVSAFPILLGFTNEFASTTRKICPGCKVTTVNVPLSQVSSGQLVPTVVAKMRTDPAVKYLIFDQASFSTGINSALNAAGLHGIRIGGNGLGPEQAAALKSGSQTAWMAYSTYYSGFQIVDIAVRHVEGVALTTNDALMPTQIVTRKTIGNITDVWNRPADALADFERLWKVPTTPCSLGCRS